MSRCENATIAIELAVYRAGEEPGIIWQGELDVTSKLNVGRYKPGVVFIVTFIVGMISFAQYLTAWILYLQKRSPMIEEEESSEGGPSYSQIKKKLKRAGIAETPAIKKAFKAGAPPAEIMKMVNDLMREDEENDEHANSGRPLAAEKPKVFDTLIFQLPLGIIRFGYNIVSGQAFKKQEKKFHEEFVPDYEEEEEEYDDLEEEVKFDTKVSGAATVAKERSTVRPSERLRQNRLKKEKKRREDEEDEEDEEEKEKVERRKKKTLGPGMIRSASGVVMSKEEFIKSRQKK
ncbi:hypothetical protein HDU96_005140 [Phlyctochytrium bullatum]|nr:hypothetical protein HDU96_005140 [Phlyctochytrium bullatum]